MTHLPPDIRERLKDTQELDGKAFRAYVVGERIAAEERHVREFVRLITGFLIGLAAGLWLALRLHGH